MATRYWVGGTGTWDSTDTTHWSATSGGTGGASAPVAADNVNFDSNSGTGTVTLTATGTCASATHNSANIEVALSGNATIAGSYTLTLGTLSLQNNTFTCRNFGSNNSNTRTLAFGSSGQLNLTGNSLTLLTATSTLTVTGTSKINCTYSGSTGTRTITAGTGISEANALNINITAGTDIVTLGTGNSTYGSVNFTGFSGTLAAGNRICYGDLTYSSTMTVAASSGGWLFSGTTGTKTITCAGQTLDGLMTFNGGATYQFADAVTLTSARTLTVSKGTLKFKAGTTNTAGAFTFVGTNVNPIVISSTTSGTQYTLSDASGTNSAAYMTISDCVATGGASWYAYLENRNLDYGNNTGWLFITSYQYSDVIMAGLNARGYFGSLDDAYRAYLLARTSSTDGTINDLEYKFFKSKGFTGNINDMLRAYAISKGISGSYNDQLLGLFKTTAFDD